jgi:hypothetical protein
MGRVQVVRGMRGNTIRAGCSANRCVYRALREIPDPHSREKVGVIDLLSIHPIPPWTLACPLFRVIAKEEQGEILDESCQAVILMPS